MKTFRKCLAVALALLLAAGFTLSAAAWDYTVKSGDSFWKISKQYGVDFYKLIDANRQVKNPNLIYPGDVLTVPDGETAEYGGAPARAVLQHTNSQRTQNGLSGLSLSAELCAVAQAKAPTGNACPVQR